MLVLGFHGGHKRVDEENKVGFALHDSAAALVRDGEVLAAIEEGSWNGTKHSICFPGLSIRYCRDRYPLTFNDLDMTVTMVTRRGGTLRPSACFLKFRTRRAGSMGGVSSPRPLS